MFIKKPWNENQIFQTSHNSSFASEAKLVLSSVKTMNESAAGSQRVDRTAFQVTTFAEADSDDRAFWFSRTPVERLQHVERLRELNYGPEVVDQRLQRILAVLERPRR
jgi:hypothetical protein